MSGRDARLVAQGFHETATKSDLKTLAEGLRAELATKLELHDLEDRLTKEIRTVRDAVTCDDPKHLHDLDDQTEKRFQAIEERLKRIEKRVN